MIFKSVLLQPIVLVCIRYVNELKIYIYIIIIIVVDRPFSAINGFEGSKTWRNLVCYCGRHQKSSL